MTGISTPLKPMVAIVNGLVNPIPPIKGGGPQIVIYNTSQFLKDTWFDWRVFSLWDPELDELTYKNDRVIQVKIRKFEKRLLQLLKHLPHRIVNAVFGVVRQDHLGLNLAMIRNLREIKPDLIVVHESYSLTYLCHLFFPHTPTILYYHSCKLHRDLSEPRWNRLVKSANAGIITICMEALILARGAFDQLPKHHWTILNGVNPYLVSFLGEKKNLRQKFGLPSESIIFIYSGRIHPQKGLDLLIKAVEQVSAQTEATIKLLIAGSAVTDEDGSITFEEELRREAAKSAPDIVRFLGYVPNQELAQYYSLSDFGILPTRLLEGNSLFLMECLTSGLPVIATRKGGVPEVVRDGYDGILLEEATLESDLAPAMLKFIEDQALWTSKRSEIASSAAERFNYQRVAKEFEQVVTQILRDKLKK